jgi:hypothetical protein
MFRFTPCLPFETVGAGECPFDRVYSAEFFLLKCLCLLIKFLCVAGESGCQVHHLCKHGKDLYGRSGSAFLHVTSFVRGRLLHDAFGIEIIGAVDG